MLLDLNCMAMQTRCNEESRGFTPGQWFWTGSHFLCRANDDSLLQIKLCLQETATHRATGVHNKSIPTSSHDMYTVLAERDFPQS